VHDSGFSLNTGFIVLGVGLFMLIAFNIAIFIRSRIDSQRFYRQNCEKNYGQELVNIYQFFEGGICAVNPMTGNVLNYEYVIINKIINDKNFIVLISQAKLHFILDKTTFTVGSVDDFISFINSKITPVTA